MKQIDDSVKISIRLSREEHDHLLEIKEKMTGQRTSITQLTYLMVITMLNAMERECKLHPETNIIDLKRIAKNKLGTMHEKR